MPLYAVCGKYVLRPRHRTADVGTAGLAGGIEGDPQISGRIAHAQGNAAALLDALLGFTRLRLGLDRVSGAHEWTGGFASLATADNGRTTLSIGDDPLQVSFLTMTHASDDRRDTLTFSSAVARLADGARRSLGRRRQ